MSFKLVSLAVLLISSSVIAHEIKRSDDHAPIGVMGDHLHHTNSWMLSYRWMPMGMSQLRQGSRRINDESVPGMMTPRDMSMSMHMLGVMYGYSNHVTVMAMTRYHLNDMSMTMRQGAVTDSDVSGMGDTTVGVLVRLKESPFFKAHYGLAIGIPTGSVDATHNGQTVGYAMQMGSGTIDLNPSLTLKWVWPSLSMGTQTSALIRTTVNHSGYQLGHKLASTVWIAKPVSSIVSLSTRLSVEYQTRITGSHQKISNTPQSIGLSTRHSGAKQMMLGVGVNTRIESSSTMYISAEYTMPIYQNLNGIQFELDPYLTVGTTVSF